MSESLIKYFKSHPTRFYLLLVNLTAAIFLIIFQNTGLLPFHDAGDFLFFVLLGILLAIYRPGWCFVFFIGLLALENINLAPKTFPLAIRPYQLLGFLTFIGFLVRYLSKRSPFSWPRLGWIDAVVLLFALSGFISAFFSPQKGISIKQAAVALSFVFLYTVARMYIQSLDDLKRVLPFFLSGSFLVALYAIWQNVRFAKGLNSFEVMAGRPNATFTESDWLGIYLVFSLSIILAIIFYQKNKKTKISNFQFLNYICLTFLFVTLILTVSRSAWFGALMVVLGFLIATLFDGSRGFSNLEWKKMGRALGAIAAASISASVIIYVFNLTTFQLFSRAQSAGGLQKITIACAPGHGEIPAKINSLDDLTPLGCRHINLEDINKEKNLGNDVLETYRPDPNIGIRAKIYAISFAQIKEHPVFGIGWGTISSILGTDENGAGLNASNIFLETWLGSGILGVLSLLILLGYIFSVRFHFI